MKPAVKDPAVKVNSPETVPPAEMIGDQQQGQIFIDESAIQINLVEIPFCFPDGIKSEEWI